MAVAGDISAPVELRRSELDAVLRSSLFAKAPSLCNLLSYLTNRTLAGEAEQLKEYTVAVEVFGRKPDFDQDADSIVRVEVNRLRKRLKQYYEDEGASHEVQITIPVGQYAVVFEAKQRPVAEAKATDHQAPGASKSRARWIIGVVLLGLAAAATAAFLTWHRQKAAAPEQPPTEALKIPAGLPFGDEVRILCGATRSYTDHAGKTWAEDQFFTGGTPVHNSVATIWRTLDPAMYRSSRQGDFSYDIPLKRGVYELRLHFAETQYGPEETADGGEGSRLMGVTVNDRQVLSYFDVVADAAGSRTADVKVFPDVQPASDGQLHLRFASMHGGRAMVSAIEVVPGARGSIRPVRILTRETAYYSDDGRWWSPDSYFKGGQTWQHVAPVEGAIDEEFFATERWGNFSYAIPVAPGKYNVTLWFAERNFGASNRERYSGPPELAGGGVGSRVFDVLCNGKTLLHDFDILKEAGTENRAVEKRFAGLEPNAQGKLVLEFVPTRNYAAVTAIEVVAQE